LGYWRGSMILICGIGYGQERRGEGQEMSLTRTV
jgi:hypothetical protein